MDFVPFVPEFIHQAADLIAARQKTLRQDDSTLPDLYEQIEQAVRVVHTAWDLPESCGMAAFSGDDLIGYLFGDISEDELRGKHVKIRLGGHCLAQGQDWDLMRDLYSKAACDWVEQGCFNHFAFSFATPEDLAPWENLVFAREHAYAICELTATTTTPYQIPAGLEIRAAVPEDADSFRSFSTIISGTQSQSPSWAPALSSHVTKMREGYAGVPADPDAQCWIAFWDGEPAGFIAFFEPEKEDLALMIPEKAIELSISGTLRSVQGKGVGTALVERALCELSEQGFKYCIADWHLPNLLSSRFWPSRGFVPAVYRMKRVIDSRILDAQVAIP